MIFNIDYYLDLLKTKNRKVFFIYLIPFILLAFLMATVYKPMIWFNPGFLAIGIILFILIILFSSGIYYSIIEKGFGEKYETNIREILKKGIKLLIFNIFVSIFWIVITILIAVVLWALWLLLAPFVKGAVFIALLVLLFALAIIYLVMIALINYGLFFEFVKTKKYLEPFAIIRKDTSKVFNKDFVLSFIANAFFVSVVGIGTQEITTGFVTRAISQNQSIIIAFILILISTAIQLLLKTGLYLNLIKVYSNEKKHAKKKAVKHKKPVKKKVVSKKKAVKKTKKKLTKRK